MCLGDAFVSNDFIYMHIYIDYLGLIMVRIISISDEVYEELSRIKNGKSFTELLKTMLTECANKGDPKSILSFLNANEALSEDASETILAESKKGRKNAIQRKSASE